MPNPTTAAEWVRNHGLCACAGKFRHSRDCEEWAEQVLATYARQEVEAALERAISKGKWWVPEDQHGAFADAIRALAETKRRG